MPTDKWQVMFLQTRGPLFPRSRLDSAPTLSQHFCALQHRPRHAQMCVLKLFFDREQVNVKHEAKIHFSTQQTKLPQSHPFKVIHALIKAL